MRVLLFTNIYPSPRNPANGMWIVEQQRSLEEKGIGFDVIHIDPVDTRLNYITGFGKLVRRLRQNRYDVLHTHDAYTFFLAYVARMLTLVRLPIVFTIHEQELLRARRKVNDVSRLRLWLSPLLLLRRSIALRRLGAALADFVVVVSTELLEILSPRRPAEVIPCGVDLEKFRPLDRERCRRELQVSSSDVIVFHPANPSGARKRLYLSQDACQVLQSRLASKVALMVGGKIPHDRMPLYYNAADVVLQTSVLESSPTIIKEALACETPIVSTDAGDTREMLAQIPCCFVCEDDASILALRMQAVLSQRAVGGRERVREKGLGLDCIADRVLRVYDRVLTNKVSATEVV